MDIACPTAESAAEFVPGSRSLPKLRTAAKGCRGCPLYCYATQTVFGEGPADAKIMLVGEQPGNDEDKTGKPFTGPAGRLLDKALGEAGLDRKTVYVTNAVKHFKFIIRGSLRQHRSPGMREIKACKPWLEAEIEAVQPQLILCLGGTATKSLIGKDATLKATRGKWFAEPHGARITTTFHPSSILRARDDRQLQFDTLVHDIAQAAKKIK